MGNLPQAATTGVQRALLGHDGARRGLFGVGEIVGVLANVSGVHALGGQLVWSALTSRWRTAADRSVAESDRVEEDARGGSERAQGGTGTRAE